jgi:hypothetical protein
MTTVELIERVVRLELQQAPLEVLASEMLAPLLVALDARAGALLCYRRDEGALALAAGRGLAASAAEQLGMVRWGGAGTWEMPLRALLERKVYYVGGGELRPLVAELMGADETSTITAIPLHRWHQPVGVVLAIGDRDVEPERILAHRLAYDVLAIALGAALWGGPRAATSDAAAVPPPTLVCEAWRDVGAHGLVHGATTVDGRLTDNAAIDAMLRDLRGAVDALRAERRLEEAERVALAERLAEAEGARAEHAARTAMLERELERHTAMLTGARGELVGDASVAAPAEANEIDVADVAPVEAEAPSAGATPNDAPPPAHRVFDADSTRRNVVAAALGAAIPNPSGGGLVAANLCDASVAMLAEVTAAARDGATVIAYAADDTRSRILGAVRCFAEPPASGEVTAGLESQPRGGRRLISLSDDIDAFIPAKVELAKLGYSVSMACDDKQAIDLLALLNPDAVLVDLRKTPEAAAMFIDALAPEGGRMLMLLVHGDPEQGALRRALERLMRPAPLDAVELARVCRLVVGNVSAAARAAAKSTLRPVERADTKLKRAGSRA